MNNCGFVQKIDLSPVVPKIDLSPVVPVVSAHRRKCFDGNVLANDYRWLMGGTVATMFALIARIFHVGFAVPLAPISKASESMRFYFLDKGIGKKSIGH